MCVAHEITCRLASIEYHYDVITIHYDVISSYDIISTCYDVITTHTLQWPLHASICAHISPSPTVTQKHPQVRKHLKTEFGNLLVEGTDRATSEVSVR